MGERIINPLFNIQDKYKSMNIINPYRFAGKVSPVYEDNGGITFTDSSNDFEAVYPSTVNQNDILIAQLGITVSSAPIPTPSGWNSITQVNSSNWSIAFFWKRATGSESGTQYFDTISGWKWAVMSRYSGCVTTGTPYDRYETNGITVDNAPVISSIVSDGVGRLSVGLVCIEDDRPISGNTTYTKAFELQNTGGTDCTMAGYYYSAGDETVPEETLSTLFAEYWGTIAIMLKA